MSGKLYEIIEVLLLVFFSVLAVPLRKAVAANTPVLIHTANAWVAVFDFAASGGRPKTVPLTVIYDQACCASFMHMHCIGL